MLLTFVIIQMLDPVGVCTKDIFESLIVQTEIDDCYPFNTLEILVNDMELVTKGKKKQIAEKYNLGLDDVEDIYDYLKTLNPFPAAEYSTDYSNYIVPEAQVVKEESDINVYLRNNFV